MQRCEPERDVTELRCAGDFGERNADDRASILESATSHLAAGLSSNLRADVIEDMQWISAGPGRDGGAGPRGTSGTYLQ
jgi:hypothetical protein